MSRRIVSRLIAAGAALFLAVLASFPALAASFAGELGNVTDSQITGWALDQDETDATVTVELTLAGANGPGSSVVLPVTANQALDNKGNAAVSGHGFVCEVDWASYSGDTFVVTAEIVSGDTRTPIAGVFTYKKEAGASQRGNKPSASGPASKDKPLLYDSDLNKIGPGFGDESASRLKEQTEADSVQTAVNHEGPASAAKDTKGELLGTFRVSGYCACSICSGGTGLTYSGKPPKANHTIAADLSLYPLGTKLMIDGTVYTVEDTGGSIVGDRLDIYFDDHETALNFGIQTLKVYSVK